MKEGEIASCLRVTSLRQRWHVGCNSVSCSFVGARCPLRNYRVRLSKMPRPLLKATVRHGRGCCEWRLHRPKPHWNSGEVEEGSRLSDGVWRKQHSRTLR
ncbi:hypothetical protein BABINDRAFT_118449 [Babjeviella inositovora NRRL Y-12698]|uniref:Uncharacterized protein n=1 Tax=Babjeviella inositovora NRRL Y-12698 TaxID=984486 RepID=A0A1E3QTI0_9ASCO|nr:uncharacterized protein BABINDRAFT_118449 [Babjeviella inositovora NRRL Y-12698]ODQ80950.1 hypothetical protein BABINDRAFT_118449 [Babjeviella inositovora NRRL Y-12698]